MPCKYEFKAKVVALKRPVCCFSFKKNSYQQWDLMLLMKAAQLRQFLFVKQPLFRQACELAFAECDTKGDNYCMEKELADIFRHAVPDMNEDEVHGLFNLFDTNNDGRISRDDFISCLRKNPLLIALFSPRSLQKDLSKAGDRMLGEIV